MIGALSDQIKKFLELIIVLTKDLACQPPLNFASSRSCEEAAPNVKKEISVQSVARHVDGLSGRGGGRMRSAIEIPKWV